LFWD
jgi:hypothetical protein